jgi:TetR/AcrR family transcriptional regulator, cholesterol catabolism regulator
MARGIRNLPTGWSNRVPRQPAPRASPRRAEICRTAAQIMLQRGYDATSVNDIARALGMTKAGLYHYIRGKEALLFEIISFGLDQVRDEVVRPVQALRDPEARLRQLVARHALIITRGHGAVAHLTDEVRALPPPMRKKINQRMRAYFDLVRSMLAELKAAGRLRNVDLTVAAFGIIGTIIWFPRWYRPGGRLTAERASAEISGLALASVLRPQASVRRPRLRLVRRGRR